MAVGFEWTMGCGLLRLYVGVSNGGRILLGELSLVSRENRRCSRQCFLALPREAVRSPPREEIEVLLAGVYICTWASQQERGEVRLVVAATCSRQ